GADLRLIDRESGADTGSDGSAVVGRITVVEDTGEIGSGNYITQPKPRSVGNHVGAESEQRVLTLIHGVGIRQCRTVQLISKYLAAVDVLLSHKLHRGVIPATAGSVTVSRSILQILTMVQNVRFAKRTVDRSLCLCQTFGVHLRTDIRTSGDIRIVHDVSVHI